MIKTVKSRRLLLGVFILILVSIQLVITANAISIVKKFNSPEDFPTGLTSDGTYLWVCDFGSELIYKVDPDDGSVMDSFSTPDTDPVGLAWDGEYLWHVDGGRAWTLGEEAEIFIYKINPLSGVATKMFKAPGGFVAEDLAWGDGHLWYVDGESGPDDYGTTTIYKIDVSNGDVVKEFRAPGNEPSGLTWDGSHLWHSDPGAGKIYLIDPDNGEVIDSFSSLSEYPDSLAWDGTYLWCVDWDSEEVYSVDVDSFLNPEQEEESGGISGFPTLAIAFGIILSLFIYKNFQR